MAKKNSPSLTKPQPSQYFQVNNFRQF